MPRTTVNIDRPVLRDLKRIQKRENKPLGRIISDLLAQALGQKRQSRVKETHFNWVTKEMHARIALTDKEGLYRAMEDDTLFSVKETGSKS
ncbi:MAG TPA: hypothetical protein VGQ81_12530 [Acidobacteriota bacterium]|nr:hypothetical protein [Acidobacteriota bacterium]